jgi:hypothetical protein
MDFNERKLKQIRKIPEELYVEKWQDQYFGSQKINSIQVFSQLFFIIFLFLLQSKKKYGVLPCP